MQLSTKTAARLRRSAVIVLGIYLLLVAALGIFQRTLIYFPSHASEAEMLAKARSSSVEPWRDAHGEIIGWTRGIGRTPPAANRLVVFHGNSGYALLRTHFIDGFEQLDDGRLWQVYLFEYPGFGARPGVISEPSFRAAGAAAIHLLQEADSRPIYLLGESLGSGLACAMVHDQPSAIAGLLLITPYSRLRDAAGAHYPIVPVGLLLSDHWDNISALPNFHGRVGIRLAGKDAMIPIDEGRRLFDVANEPKRLWVVPGVGHNQLDYSLQAPWWRDVSDFLLGRKEGVAPKR
jgi:hypothetical protein